MTATARVDPTRDETTVRFTLPRDEPATDVSVVGSFNSWTPGMDTLEPDEDGTRSVTVRVVPGRDVVFRYLAHGGVWFDDPDADEITEHGSVLWLASRRGADRV